MKAGILVKKKVGDEVEPGEPVALLYTDLRKGRFSGTKTHFRRVYYISHQTSKAASRYRHDR